MPNEIEAGDSGKEQTSSHREERLVRLLTWATGRKPGNTRKDWKTNGMLWLKRYPAVVWEYAPTGDFLSLTIHVIAAPNALHRGLQRLAFGVRYRLLPNAGVLAHADEKTL